MFFDVPSDFMSLHSGFPDCVWPTDFPRFGSPQGLFTTWTRPTIASLNRRPCRELRFPSRRFDFIDSGNDGHDYILERNSPISYNGELPVSQFNQVTGHRYGNDHRRSVDIPVRRHLDTIDLTKSDVNSPVEKRHYMRTESVDRSIPMKVYRDDVDLEGRKRPTDDGGDSNDIKFVGTSQELVSPRKPRSLSNVEEDIANGEMLTDETINLAQNLLQKQFPEISGLEDTTLGPVKSFSVSRGPFLQILHDPERCHWVCVSNIGAGNDVVYVYDSLSRDILSPTIEEQIRCIVNDEDEYVSIEHPPVQQQSNSTDCGVFAVAFATSLLFGDDPRDVRYDISRMRSHLMECLLEGCMRPFPSQ